jgi:hypothetical protein
MVEEESGSLYNPKKPYRWHPSLGRLLCLSKAKNESKPAEMVVSSHVA